MEDRYPNENLRTARRRASLSQEELAERVGVRPITIHTWEAGKARPQPVHARNLCKVLDASLEELGLEEAPVVLPDHSDHPDPDMGALQAFRLADRQIGGGHLYASVVSYLTASMGPRLLAGGGATFAAASSLTEMCAWMAHDGGHDEEARSHFGRAWDLAHGAHAPELQADVAAGRAHLELHLGEADMAIASAEQGRDRLVGAARQPGLLARLYVMEARGQAALGRARESAHSLHLAEAALASRDGEASLWVAPFDEASLAGETALALHQVGDHGGARLAAERVLQLRPADRARSRAFAQLSLAQTLLSQPRPDPGSACSLAHAVLDGAGAVASARIGRELRKVRTLLEPYRSSGEVQGFIARLDTSPTTALWRIA